MIEGVQNKVLSVYLIKNLYLSDHPPFRAITIRMVFELIHEFIILMTTLTINLYSIPLSASQ